MTAKSDYDLVTIDFKHLLSDASNTLKWIHCDFFSSEWSFRCAWK
jgi:hypothetical protein